MAITNSNIYQDLIMNPDSMPNRLQNLQMFPPVDVPSRIDFTSGDELVPGMGVPAINYTDAPVRFMMRQNSPTKGLDQLIDYRALNLGTPEATAKYLAKNNFPMPQNLEGIDTRNFLDKTKDKLGQGFNIGKQALLSGLGFATGIPLGILGMLPERDYRQNVIEDFYSDPNTRGLVSRIPGMENYNTVSGGLLNALTGGKMGEETTFGLSGAIDKRIARINKTLAKQRKDKKRQESEVLKQRLKDLQALKDREAKTLADAKAKQTSSFDPSGPTQASIRSSREDRSGRGQSGGFTNPGKGSYGPFS